jgi:ATP-dependent protease ClpP protease subunit
MKNDAFNFAPVVRGENKLELRNESGKTDLFIIGTIGASFWDDSGITEKEFRNALDTVPKGTKFNIRINSEGGSIGAGLGMYNAIKERREDATSIVDGYALSIASVIALGAGKVISPKSSVWMIHNAWSLAQGNADDMRQEAVLLDEHDSMLAEIYSAETGKSVQEIRALMKGETWIRGSKAVEFGLADESDEDQSQASMRRPSPEWLKAAMTRCSDPGKKILNSIFPALKNMQGADNKTTERKNMSDENKAALPASQPDQQAEIKALREQAAKERENRIRLTIDNLVLTNKVPNAEADAEVRACVLDESRIAILNSRNPVTPPEAARPLEIGGGDKIAFTAINAKTPGKERRAFLLENWNQLRDAGVPVLPSNPSGCSPVAANTDTAAGVLTVGVLSNSFLTVLQTKLAPLNSLMINYAAGTIGRNVIEVPIVVAGGSAGSNSTTFEDSTNYVNEIDDVAVTPAHIVAGGHLTSAELQNGWRLSWWAEQKAAEFGVKIKSLVNAIITTTNFTATPLKSAAGSFTASDLKTLWGQLKNAGRKNIILDGEYYARFLPDNLESFNPLAGNTFPGFDLFVNDNYWTGATTNTVGFACNPQAIGGAIGQPVEYPNVPGASTLGRYAFTVPGIGIEASNFQWFNNSTRTAWWTIECMAGFAKSDASAGVLIMSA